MGVQAVEVKLLYVMDERVQPNRVGSSLAAPKPSSISLVANHTDCARDRII